MISIITFDSFLVKKMLRVYFKKHRPKVVLDLGCGSGSLASLFTKSSYSGFDADKKLIEYARLKHPGYTFFVSDATNFNFKNKFDLILIVGVLHHLEDANVEKALRCMRKHLKGSGRIFIVEAIPPIFKWNLVGGFLRSIDKGNWIRPMERYRALIEKQFKVEYSNSVLGGLIDYAVITGRSK